jgi:hypothetical protein
MRGYLMKTRITESLGIEYPKSLPTVEFDNTGRLSAPGVLT